MMKLHTIIATVLIAFSAYSQMISFTIQSSIRPIINIPSKPVKIAPITILPTQPQTIFLPITTSTASIPQVISPVTLKTNIYGMSDQVLTNNNIVGLRNIINCSNQINGNTVSKLEDISKAIEAKNVGSGSTNQPQKDTNTVTGSFGANFRSVNGAKSYQFGAENLESIKENINKVSSSRNSLSCDHGIASIATNPEKESSNQSSINTGDFNEIIGSSSFQGSAISINDKINNAIGIYNQTGVSNISTSVSGNQIGENCKNINIVVGETDNANGTVKIETNKINLQRSQINFSGSLNNGAYGLNKTIELSNTAQKINNNKFGQANIALNQIIEAKGANNIAINGNSEGSSVYSPIESSNIVIDKSNQLGKSHLGIDSNIHIENHNNDLSSSGNYLKSSCNNYQADPNSTITNSDASSNCKSIINDGVDLASKNLNFVSDFSNPENQSNKLDPETNNYVNGVSNSVQGVGNRVVGNGNQVVGNCNSILSTDANNVISPDVAQAPKYKALSIAQSN